MSKKYLFFFLTLFFVFSFSIQELYYTPNSRNEIGNSVLDHQNLQLKKANNVSLLDLFTAQKESERAEIKVLPGGQSIGVTLETKGVLVVGYAPIINHNGEQCFPAKDAGVEVGDSILKINGVKAENDAQVAKEINEGCKKNKEIVLELKKEGRIIEKRIKPVYCSETERYRIGLYIRDEAAGVGTLTFFDPVSKKFGALGHVITDVDTNDKIELSNGKVVESAIYAIEKGKRGDPGEKIGTFLLESSFSGKIEKNSDSGIFGIYSGQIKQPFFNKPISVGWPQEIELGTAKIYTVIHDNKIEEFEVKIEKTMPYRNDNKNMIIKITDPALIERTGGIVQGMSGSPVIQNGKIIGAVTHVFVNDSTRGYGVFIEKMLKDSNLLTDQAAIAPLTGASFNVNINLQNKRFVFSRRN